MKSEKGITLMILIVYLVVMCIVIGMLGMVSELFFANTKYITENSKYISEYNKFAMYFIEDVKNNKNTYKVTDTQVIFEDGTIYTYEKEPDNSIYRNKVKICNNITFCNFSKKEEVVDNITKNIVQVHMIIKGSKYFEATNQFVLKYW